MRQHADIRVAADPVARVALGSVLGASTAREAIAIVRSWKLDDWDPEASPRKSFVGALLSFSENWTTARRIGGAHG